MLSALAAAPAFAAAVDSQAEIAAALYAASATQAVEQRLANATIQAAHAKIDALTAQVRAGAAQRAALIEAQNHYVAQLAAIDRSYSVEIAVFRGAVTDIASTPEGLDALAKYNGGDTQGALSILDKLRAARAAARRKADDIADAADARTAAELALNFRDKGKVDTASVIARYEEVTQLDPGENWDWVELTRLYKDAGRLADAAKAARKISRCGDQRPRPVGGPRGGRRHPDQPGRSDRRTQSLRSEPGHRHQGRGRQLGLGHGAARHSDRPRPLGHRLARQRGNLPGARTDFEAALATARRLAGADPSSTDLRRDLVVCLTPLGDVQTARAIWLQRTRPCRKTSVSCARCWSPIRTRPRPGATSKSA